MEINGYQVNTNADAYTMAAGIYKVLVSGRGWDAQDASETIDGLLAEGRTAAEKRARLLRFALGLAGK